VHGSPTGLSKVMTTDKHLHAAMAGYVERGEIPGIVTLIGRGDEILVDAIGRKTVGGKEPHAARYDFSNRVDHQTDHRGRSDDFG